MNDHETQLAEYIASQQQLGISNDAIRQALVSYGWDAGMVERALVSPGPQAGISDVYAGQQGTAVQPAEQRDAPTKYKVTRAIADALRSIAGNIVAYVVSVIAAVVGAIILMFLLTTVAGAVGIGGVGLLGKTTGSALSVSLIISLVIMTFLVTTLATTLIIACTSLAVRDSADGRKSSIKHLLLEAIQRLPRVIMANLLASLAIAGPLIAAATLLIIVTILASHAGRTPAVLTFIGILMILAGTVWVLIAMLRYTLVPYVALFEPELPIIATLHRSHHLLRHGGQWFIFKGFSLLFIIVLILSGISGQNIHQLENSTSWIINGFLLLLDVIASGVLVMLYRNRSIVRGN